ncbi:separin protein [Pseudogymnoascus australis]
MTSLHDKLELVKSALGSTSTSTSATVSTLSDLLVPKNALSSQKDAIPVGAAGRKRAATQTTQTKPGRTTRPAAKKTLAASQKADSHEAEELSAKEKAILATEVINLTLKTLSAAATSSNQVRKQPQSRAHLETPVRKALRRSNSLPQSPLHPRSLNRVTSSPNVGNRLIRSPSSSSTSTPLNSSGPRAVAECSRIAFACLRMLQSSKTTAIELPFMQIENGMSALVGKLILLGLDDLALKELRILKRRLDAAFTPSEKPRAKKETAKDISPSIPSLSPLRFDELIDFETVPTEGPFLNIAFTTQLQALKLLATSKKPSAIIAAIPKLQPEYHCSPTQLLVQASRISSSLATKSARQLESLAQIILSLSPSISSSEDTAAISPKLHVGPDAALQLQTIAFCTRYAWWPIAGHKGDIDNDIFEPYSRCVAAFTRRSRGLSASAYECALQSYNALLDFTAARANGSKVATGSPVYVIHKLLASLAQDSGCDNEAIRWVEKLQGCENSSEAQKCAIASKLVALKLRTDPHDPVIEELLMTVVQGLESSIKGDGTELDELLTEVSRARRAAIMLVSKKPEASDDATETINEGPRQLCESLVLQCPRFSLRYLGKAPGNEASTKVIVRFEQRRHHLARSVPSTVDSALYLAKALRAQGRLTWEIMDSLLQDCLALLDAADVSMPDSNNDSDSTRASYYARISNLYYSQHLDMRRDASSPKDVQHLRPLRRSIDSVRSRPIAEKKAAALTAKLERMGDLLRFHGRLDEAKDIILLLRDELIADGALALVASAASTLPIRASWDQTENTLLLARAFSLLVKLNKKAPSTLHDISFNDEPWAPEEKGVVFEHILDILSRQPEASSELQKAVYKELTTIYDARTFPIRRLRVLCNFAQTNPDQRRDTIEEARSTTTLASLDSVVASSSDSGLSQYTIHIRSLLTSTLELMDDHPRIDLIEPHLATWSSIIDKCKDQAALSRNIDNVEILQGHLHSVADFLDMKGYGKTRVAVLRMIANIDEIPRGSNPDDLVLDYCFLASQYLDLGYSGKAGLALDKAQCLASSHGVTPNASIRRLVGYADYLLRVGNLDKCDETLSRAHQAAEHENKTTSGSNATSYSDRDGNDRIIADASIVYSDLALQQGKPQEALVHAKRSLRIIARAWKRAERNQLSRAKKIQSSDDSTMEKLGEESSNLNLSTTSPGLPQVQNTEIGPSAWMLARPMFRCFIHLSQVYTHHGMFQDTIYYAEQAHKIAVSIDSTNYIVEALALIGGAWLKAGNIEKASEFLTQAKDLASVQKEAQALVVLSGNLGSLHSVHGDKSAELAAYGEAERTLSSLTNSTYIGDLDRVFDVTVILQAEISRLTIDDTKKRGRPQRKTVAKAPARKREAVSKQPATVPISIAEQCVGLVSLKGAILRQKARSFARWNRFEDSSIVLEEAAGYSLSSLDAIETHVARAECLFRQSSALLPADSVYSVLQDSTISFPAVVGVKTASLERVSAVRTTPPKKNAPRNASLPRGSTMSWVDPLKQAHDHLVEAYSTASQISSTRVLTQIASFLNTTSLLLSTYHGLKLKAIQPGAVASALELAKTAAVQRERDAVMSDVDAETTKEGDLRWPVTKNQNHQNDSNGRLAMQQSRFQKEYIDIIPSAWKVVSVMLSESRDELVLAKFEAGHSPFILRVPLERNSSRDADEEVFGFDQGKAELHEIIDLANASAHGGRDVSSREGKIAWWAERDELNVRLKELLDNVEKVWLGGFKGIFSQHTRNPDLLARFQKSFQNTLDKYLPSRQRTNKRKKASPGVTLDPRILELFVGLGDPFSGDCDLDEPLTDLLYFVVDILQFHGERNAYDEIDFDSMVLDTLDALRCYHQAVAGSGIATEQSHTVLILDKSLHSLPWESLPCMEGQAVSRLPSMGCLRDRILSQQKKVAAEGQPDGTYINRSKGSYVLNPGQDLKTTQATFEKGLQNLDDWSSVVEREPVETELKDMLAKDDLYLYFGHGSGAQYIRSKTIKKLETCATTFLMGCSSATLVDVGEFMPYGPPMSYMIAGAPAVVGTLWDVTDKDIDRFAKSTFESWGLYEGGAAVAVEKAPKTPGRGRKKVEPVEVERERVSLVKAVAEGKKACHFKYLTAAAVVVYGVPVYFE